MTWKFYWEILTHKLETTKLDGKRWWDVGSWRKKWKRRTSSQLLQQQQVENQWQPLSTQEYPQRHLEIPRQSDSKSDRPCLPFTKIGIITAGLACTSWCRCGLRPLPGHHNHEGQAEEYGKETGQKNIGHQTTEENRHATTIQPGTQQPLQPSGTRTYWGRDKCGGRVGHYKGDCPNNGSDSYWIPTWLDEGTLDLRGHVEGYWWMQGAESKERANTWLWEQNWRGNNSLQTERQAGKKQM